MANLDSRVDNSSGATWDYQKSTFTIAGQRVAIKVSGDPWGPANGIFHVYSDHLGSTGALSDDAGVLLGGSLAKHTPFGDWRKEPTVRRDSRTYTGHQGNNLGSGADDLGLIYMVARFYLPSIGRFASADTIVPDPANPQSLNRYSYALNSPANYNDPSGHCVFGIDTAFCIAFGGGLIVGGVIGLAVNQDLLPWNPPTLITSRVTDSAPITSNNMTGWLRNQMVTNAQSQVVQNINQNWHSFNPVNKDAALQAWTALVGTGATWDFKVDIKKQDWFRVGGERDVILGGKRLNWDAVANIHFGFVGRAAGFGGDFLVQAAGLAQWQHWRQTGKPEDEGACNFTYYCDHPYAIWSIRFGIYLYDLYGDRLDHLDDDALAQALADYMATYGEPPDPPAGAVGP